MGFGVYRSVESAVERSAEFGVGRGVKSEIAVETIGWSGIWILKKRVFLFFEAWNLRYSRRDYGMVWGLELKEAWNMR